MSSCVRGPSTSETQIDVAWTAPTTSTATGGASILSYNLQWDKGTAGAIWYDLIGVSPASLDTELIATTGITPGQSY